MITALRGDKGTLGLLVVADRLGDVTSFVAEDLKLFETLANQAAMAFENGQLGALIWYSWPKSRSSSAIRPITTS